MPILSEYMSQNTVIQLRNVGKCYPHFDSTRQRFFSALRSSRVLEAGSFWAVRGIDFALQKGECVGIVGRNGAGKSTLLQMISNIVSPTEGTVEVSGRVGALLELGAGFNPDFSGRENIRLNAAILGLSHEEIDSVIDLIILFADIGSHIDDPVRTYSSGMYVRVAFAVQVHLDPDLLIIDEALAVGDAAFQTKCFRRLRHLQEAGTAILFVSHDVQAVRMLCRRVIWLENGNLQMDGPAPEVTGAFMRALFSDDIETTPALNASADCVTQPTVANHGTFCLNLDEPGRKRWGRGEIKIETAELISSKQIGPGIFEHAAPLTLRLSARVEAPLGPDCNPSLAFSIKHRRGLDLIVDTTFCHGIHFQNLVPGQLIEAEFDFLNILAPDDYELVVAVENRASGNPDYIDFVEGAGHFKVISNQKIYSLVKPIVRIRSNGIVQQGERLGEGH